MLSVISIPGDLNLLLQLFVLYLFAFDVSVYYFCTHFVIQDNVFYSHEVTGNSFFVYCHNLSDYFVS